MHHRSSPAPLDVAVKSKDVSLAGMLAVPEHASGIVVFAHGSGSSRFSSRNRYVADTLCAAGLGTLLFDLLTPQEHTIDQTTREFRFDIDLLTMRLIGAMDWVNHYQQTIGLPIGLFGASTGAAAALRAAAERPREVAAVVSRGGRPDLANAALPQVKAPTLLIVGGLDEIVLELNREAAAKMQAAYRLATLPGATHLFEEPGKLEEVAALARDWFLAYLQRP